MDFKKLLFLLVFVVGCTDKKKSDPSSYNNIIGESLSGIQVSESSSGDQKKVVLFDETIRKLHYFDLDKMTVLKTMDVQNPSIAHTVLQHPDGNYVIDLTLKHLSIYNSNGVAFNNPIQFQGEPFSAAYKPDLGLLVMQDDLSSIGVLEISNSGQITKSWLSGSVIGGNTSVRAGDLTETGELVLALSDKSIAVANVVQSATNNSWVYSSFMTTLEEISWVAPVPGVANQVFLKSKDALVLVDTNSQAVLDSFPVTSQYPNVFLSRKGHPHAVVWNSTKFSVVYPLWGQILVKDTPFASGTFLSSKLDLVNDTWTSVQFSHYYYDGFARPLSITANIYYWSYNDYRYNRILSKYRFSDMLALQSKSLPNEAQLVLSNTFIFGLYPSKLGYATRIGVNDDSFAELKLFNLPYFE